MLPPTSFEIGLRASGVPWIKILSIYALNLLSVVNFDRWTRIWGVAVTRCTACTACTSDVNKDSGHKAKAKAKDSSLKAKAKDSSRKAKAKAKDLTKVSKAKAKDLSIVSKAKAKDLQ